jgi:hypothetical protein
MPINYNESHRVIFQTNNFGRIYDQPVTNTQTF